MNSGVFGQEVGVIQNLGGNILSYNESEDSYYIQYGADSVPKKLGNCPPVTFRIHTQGLGAGKVGVDHSSFSVNITEYNRIDASYDATYIYSIGRVEGITSGGAVTRILNAETAYDKNVQNIDISKFVTLRFYCNTAYEGTTNLQAVIYRQ